MAHRESTEANNRTFLLNEISQKEISLPRNASYTQINVRSLHSEVAEIETIELNENAIISILGAEKLLQVWRVFGCECGYVEIPRWLEELPSLRELIFYHNPIKEIPRWFVDLVGGGVLTHLSLMKCEIESLPWNLFNHRLKTASISFNSKFE